jgi:hypothetical protein
VCDYGNIFSHPEERTHIEITGKNNNGMSVLKRDGSSWELSLFSGGLQAVQSRTSAKYLTFVYDCVEHLELEFMIIACFSLLDR